MDNLTLLFSHHPPSVNVIHEGKLCETASFDERSGLGYIHLLRAGELIVMNNNVDVLSLKQPSILFYPGECTHRLQPLRNSSVHLLCASVDLGGLHENPLSRSLPEFLVVPFRDVPVLERALDIMLDEAYYDGQGRKAALDSLMTYFLVVLLRHVLKSGTMPRGIFAGLADTRLAKAINAMHKFPDRAWTLELLAREAGMSRARFAIHFREAVGLTPMDYLTDWRLMITRTMLRQGCSLKTITGAVGYKSPSALTRVFTKKIGYSPREWIRAHHS